MFTQHGIGQSLQGVSVEVVADVCGAGALQQELQGTASDAELAVAGNEHTDRHVMDASSCPTSIRAQPLTASARFIERVCFIPMILVLYAWNGKLRYLAVLIQLSRYLVRSAEHSAGTASERGAPPHARPTTKTKLSCTQFILFPSSLRSFAASPFPGRYHSCFAFFLGLASGKSPAVSEDMGSFISSIMVSN